MPRRVRVFASAVRRGKKTVVAGHRKGDSGARRAFVFFGAKDPPKQRSLGLRAKKTAAKKPASKRTVAKRAPAARRATRRR